MARRSYQLISAFLLVRRRDNWWLHSDSPTGGFNQTLPNGTKTLLDLVQTDPGLPEGEMQQVSEMVFERRYSKLVVRLDCSDFSSTMTPTPNGAQSV